MITLRQSINEAIKSSADFSGMKILLVDLKAPSGERYKVTLFPNIGEAIPDVDVEAGRTILTQFAKRRDIYSLIINKRWLICKTGDIVKDVTIPLKSVADTATDKNDIIG